MRLVSRLGAAAGSLALVVTTLTGGIASAAENTTTSPASLYECSAKVVSYSTGQSVCFGGGSGLQRVHVTCHGSHGLYGRDGQWVGAGAYSSATCPYGDEAAAAGFQTNP